ncbi:PTPM [Bracoviriform congregatae]|uniref:PTPM protein n=1 Tax=Bracoviriform congregatae TaxID=39640 RepID=Q5ZP69_9VIRU|nr:PTPM [Bracoviriform congregatae]CAG17386.1 PTPM [Bracoviriform congregatae]CAG26732.1 protein tyrosine phosphatase [Bracoviriform congregatae]
MNTDLFAPFQNFEFLARSTHPKYTDVIADEYSRICQEPLNGTYENWKKPKNKNKNLFRNIPCWDNSRVVLHQTNDGADYINGNYVSGFELKRKFIATEQPMASTLGNFWTMIWEENTRVIVMLNGSEEEAQQSYPYLSSSQTDIISGDFKIKQKERNEEKDYTETVLIITHLNTGQSKRVSHFKYLHWPEHTFPHEEDILKFLEIINNRNAEFFIEAEEYHQRMPGAIVVHGNAGIRRTTAFCAIDSCLYEAVVKKTVSIPSVVLRIRQQRNFSFPGLSYYIYVHSVLLHFLVHH